MTASPSWPRRLATFAATGFSLIAAGVLAAGTPAGQALATDRGAAGPASAGRLAVGPIPVPGQIGSYAVDQQLVTYKELAHTGPTGDRLPVRSLVTTVLYPVLTSASTARQFPLVIFAPGYLQCAAPYLPLLRTIASAGYVVAAVKFPVTGCTPPARHNEADLVNEPQDLSYVITQLLKTSAATTGPLAGLINGKEIGAAGHSDGGDVVALLAANSCCTDHRVAATAVFSGAEWMPPPGRYFQVKPTTAMLFVQGNADPINPPACGRQLYNADRSRVRYYLDQLGANHTLPYWGTSAVEQRTALITTEFFDRWLLGQPTGPAMKLNGNVPGKAIFVSGASPAPLT